MVPCQASWPAGSYSTMNLALAISTDRKSTRLNSSHANISYAVFCLQKKTQNQDREYALYARLDVQRSLTRLNLLPPIHHLPPTITSHNTVLHTAAILFLTLLLLAFL